MKTKDISKVFLVIVACVVAYLFLLPLLFMVFTSFKGMAEAMTSTTLLPKTWTIENYVALFSNTATSPVLRWLGNTAIVTVSGTVLRITISVLAAYALARLPVPGKKFIVLSLVWAMAIPEIVTFFPLYAEHLLAPDSALWRWCYVCVPDLQLPDVLPQRTGRSRCCGWCKHSSGALAYRTSLY